MITHAKFRTATWRTPSLVAAVAAAAILSSTAAFAGACPVDKQGANALEGAATAPLGVSDTVLTSIDLSKEALKLDDRLFRLRRLEVEPNGVVPMHSHGDRPALIYVVAGTMTEHSSNCTVPITHNAGEAAMESAGLTHWWQNTGDRTAVLLSADILHTTMDSAEMM